MSFPVCLVNLKKDSENTPVKGGTMADLGKILCLMLNVPKGYSIYIYFFSIDNALTLCMHLDYFYHSLTVSLSDEQEDDFPGRVNINIFFLSEV